MAWNIFGGANVGYTTVQRDNFSSNWGVNENGTIIYNKTTENLQRWTGTEWEELTDEADVPTVYNLNGDTVQNINHNKGREVNVTCFNNLGVKVEAFIRRVDSDNIEIITTPGLTGKALII